MIMPYIEEQQTSAEMISEFRGYNHNPVIGDNEFFDMENMTSDKYPMASTRDKRGVMDLDIDGILLGIEGKDKPLVLYSDNAGALPGAIRQNLKILTETGAGGTIFDKAVSESSTTSTDNAYAYLANITFGSSSAKFFTACDEGYKLKINCNDLSFSNVESEEALQQMRSFLIGKDIYLIGYDRMCSTPLHIIGASEYYYSANHNYRYCDIYFSADEISEAGLASVTNNNMANASGYEWSPFPIATKDLEVDMSKHYGGNGYIAFYNLETKELENTTEIGSISAGEKQLVSMGANVIIFPDKKIVNTLKIANSQFTDVQSLEHTYTATGVSISSTAPNASSGSTLPTDPDDGEYFWDTSGEVAVLKQYSEALGRWATKPTYLTINASNHGFKKGDAIKIDNAAVASHVPSGQKNFVIESVSASYIRIQCNFTSPLSATSQSVTLSRVLPEMDYIIESNNRLWGCHYGLNADGEMVNEIFASKLGDPFNWFYFANTSIDSYYVSLGSEGAFTGAVNYQSTPTFFKADVIHRILGAYPAQYQLKTIEGYGVKPGCHKSISVMNDIVYYLSPVGMVVFNGGIPISLAVPFGEVRYDKCISGDIGNKLYCSMHDEFNKWSMFVYDDSNGLWHREDDLHAEDFGIYNGELLCVSENKLYSLGGVYGDKEPDFNWMLQTGDMGFVSPQRKTIRRLVLRIKLAITTRARIEIQYDNDGIWRYVNELRPTGKIRSYAVPIKPFRCDHYAIRIRGKGEFDLQSLTRHWAEGSELD